MTIAELTIKKKHNITWDATLLDAYQNCPDFFNMRHRKNKDTLTRSKPLDQGSVMHYGFEAYYDAMKDLQAFENCLEKAIMAIRVNLTASDLSTAEGERCLQVMEEYAYRWRIEDRGWEITAVESPFTYILHEDDLIKIVMIGKIDLLWSNQQYTDLPVDHKTYERDTELSRLSNQFTNYAYATDSNFLMVNRVGFQTSIKSEVKHKRVMLSYDPIFKEQWKKNTIKWAYMYYDSLAEDSWPMNQTSCWKYNKPCIFRPVCETTGEDNKIYKLHSDYIDVEEWDVSKVLTRKG